MDYFSAVKVGRARTQLAGELLREVAGNSYPVLFLQEGKNDWTPVGDEVLYSEVAGDRALVSVVLSDNEGNAKAMSDWMPREEASRIVASLKAKGIQEYTGEVRLPA
jgi:hypothetical protein